MKDKKLTKKEIQVICDCLNTFKKWYSIDLANSNININILEFYKTKENYHKKLKLDIKEIQKILNKLIF